MGGEGFLGSATAGGALSWEAAAVHNRQGKTANMTGRTAVLMVNSTRLLVPEWMVRGTRRADGPEAALLLILVYSIAPNF